MRCASVNLTSRGSLLLAGGERKVPIWKFVLYWLASIGAVYALVAPFMFWHGHLVVSSKAYEECRHFALGLMSVICLIGFMILAAVGFSALAYRLFDGHW